MSRRGRPRLGAGLAVAAALALFGGLAAQPAGAAPGTDPAEAEAWFQELYLGGQTVAPTWAGGSLSDCRPGQTDEAFPGAVVELLNYYRRLAGTDDLSE
ncbi:MAG: hypothetical protein LBL55_02480, partial [Propionibacteriaceae bacterium]|nr:hypothetical protein [Propionibacteriaceae bacterium]